MTCPTCSATLGEGPGWACAAGHDHAEIDGVPVLIDFHESVFSREVVLARSEGSPSGGRRRSQAAHKRLLTGENRHARKAAETLVGALPARALVLIVGGSEVGSGAQPLYDAEHLRLVAFDVRPGPWVCLVADAHRIPLAAASVDAVWVQAVLEHVLTPADVVAEIHRVLKPGGWVFADTPFLQGVHEGAYDFTRFTLSGHRWLFRNFQAIESGATGGAGTTLIWALKGLARALTRSDGVARVVAAAFFWLRFLDAAGRRQEDFASGVHFLGRRAEGPTLRPRDIVDFYDGRA